MEDNSQLDQWRAQRMAQMQAASSPNSSSPHELAQQRKKQEAMQEQRRLMLNQITTSEAREKIANIRLVKPERAEQVESYIISAAQAGQIGQKITEEQVKDLLRKVTQQTQNQTKVTIVRRRTAFDDDDDDDDDDDF